MYANSKRIIFSLIIKQVYYPLIVKKQKLGKFVEGIAGRSDATATYLLQPSEEEVGQTDDAWRSQHGDKNDVPIFRVKLLAFQRESGLEIPLFLRKEDALNSFKR